MIFFNFFYFFLVIFDENEPPIRLYICIAMARHLMFICHDPNQNEKRHLDHPLPRICASMEIKERGGSKKKDIFTLFSAIGSNFPAKKPPIIVFFLMI